jgi:hypothetical protein
LNHEFPVTAVPAVTGLNRLLAGSLKVDLWVPCHLRNREVF